MRTQTVVYQFPVLNTLTNNTLTSIGTITANFSGVQGASIQNAFVIIRAADIITATGGTITTKRIDLNVNGAGAVTVSDASTYSNTSENIFWEIPFDVTSIVSTSFQSNVSNTFALSVLLNQTTGTTLGFNNVCAELYITYQFNEATSTRLLKTVYVPIGVVNGGLPTTSTSYGTVPALATYLPEADKLFSNLAIVSDMNLTDSTTNRSLTMSLTGGLTITSQLYEGALASGKRAVYHWKLDTATFDYNNQLTFSANCSTANLIQNNVFYMVVTYTYDFSTTTNVMNSLLVGDIGGAAGNSSSLFERVTTELILPENNINARRIMALMYFSAENSNSQIRIRIEPSGSFSSTYSVTQSMSTSMRVIGAYSESIALTTGENSLMFDYYTTDTYYPKGMNILWIVNYTSTAVNGGVDNSRTIITQPMNSLARSGRFTVSNKICPLGESDYYIANGFFVLGTNIGESTITYSISAEVLVSENGATGELTHLANSLPLYSDVEIGWKFSFYPYNFNKIKRFPDDITSNKLIEVNTTRSLMVNGVSFTNLLCYTTIHSVVRTISGVVKDSANNPVNGASVFLLRLGTMPKFMKLSFSDSNGNYSFTVYDNVSNYLIYANKSGTPNIFDATDLNLAGS